MQSKITIRIKALFLLVVFSMNTLLGFACSIGVDLGYNTKHHKQDASSLKNEADHDCGGVEHETTANTSPVNTHDCCKDEVLKFNLSDKSPSPTIKINAPNHTTFSIVASYIIQSFTIEDVPSNHYYVRSDHPPIFRDIRISIHSFRI
ncbi:MAG TPA: hypothetical protein VD993_03800 [Chitinophagaceae bacterium]|nr:hypothetical protein [Chitinophagaceae bacterium]